MKRRQFIKTAISNTILLGLPITSFSNCQPKGSLRFGIITDPHFSYSPDLGKRKYNQSVKKLNEAIEVFNKSNLDFIIELGDFKDMGKEPSIKNSLRSLADIEKTFQKFKGNCYHVLGNHDMDNLSKEQFLSNITSSKKPKNKNYYSFKHKGYKCIVLDANYTKEGEDYCCNNFNWEEALIPQKEIDWLKKELKEGTEPIIIFTHQLLDSKTGLYSGLYVINSDEVNLLLQQSKRVLAVFQGHHHDGSYGFHEKIHYFTLRGMIEGDAPIHNSYAIVEITPQNDTLITGYRLCGDKIMKKSL